MSKNLIIVESPAKAKTIQKFIDKNYTVISSKGHVRDLPSKGMGIDIVHDFEPQYAHLAGAIAANTTLPVIGVPCKGPAFDGMDALLSTVQMPSGIPVATVAVNGGANAALLAAEILSVEDPELACKLQKKREAAAAAILEQDAQLEKELS